MSAIIYLEKDNTTFLDVFDNGVYWYFYQYFSQINKDFSINISVYGGCRISIDNLSSIYHILYKAKDELESTVVSEIKVFIGYNGLENLAPVYEEVPKHELIKFIVGLLYLICVAICEESDLINEGD